MDFGPGIIGLIGLGLAIWAILNIAQSKEGNLGKVVWIIVVLVIPLFGFLAWLFFGPRGKARA